MKKSLTLWAISLILAGSSCAFADYQMVYTPESSLAAPASVSLRLLCANPFFSRDILDMERPEQFFVVHREKREDLTPSLKNIKWRGLETGGAAWAVDVQLPQEGDYAFGLVPAPYLNEHENLWLQPCAKIIVNVGGMATDWDTNIGLPVEIEALAKPYALWTGNSFSGVVTSGGQPVPFAEVDVVFMNHPADLQLNAFLPAPTMINASNALAVQTIKADANGTFTYSFPRSGWWGFTAVNLATVKAGDKTVRQDAVVWTQVKDVQEKK